MRGRTDVQVYLEWVPQPVQEQLGPQVQLSPHMMMVVCWLLVWVGCVGVFCCCDSGSVKFGVVGGGKRGRKLERVERGWQRSIYSGPSFCSPPPLPSSKRKG